MSFVIRNVPTNEVPEVAVTSVGLDGAEDDIAWFYDENLAKEYIEFRQERDEALVACAEMRNVLKQCWRNAEHDPRIEFLNKRIDHALSSSCGKDMLAELERYKKALDIFKTALTLAPATIRTLQNQGFASQYIDGRLAAIADNIARDALKGPTT